MCCAATLTFLEVFILRRCSKKPNAIYQSSGAGERELTRGRRIAGRMEKKERKRRLSSMFMASVLTLDSLKVERQSTRKQDSIEGIAQDGTTHATSHTMKKTEQGAP